VSAHTRIQCATGNCSTVLLCAQLDCASPLVDNLPSHMVSSVTTSCASWYLPPYARATLVFAGGLRNVYCLLLGLTFLCLPVCLLVRRHRICLPACLPHILSACPAGKYSVKGSEACTDCPKGSW